MTSANKRKRLNLKAYFKAASLRLSILLAVLVAGFISQPKWGHLRDLHKAIKHCEEYLVNADPTHLSLGFKLEVYNFSRFQLFNRSNPDNNDN